MAKLFPLMSAFRVRSIGRLESVHVASDAEEAIKSHLRHFQLPKSSQDMLIEEIIDSEKMSVCKNLQCYEQEMHRYLNAVSMPMFKYKFKEMFDENDFCNDEIMQ